MLYSEYGQFHHDSLGISAAATSDVDGDGVPEYSVLSFDDLHTNSGGKLYLYDGASHNQRGAISGDSLAGGTGYLGNPETRLRQRHGPQGRLCVQHPVSSGQAPADRYAELRDLPGG